MTVTVEFAPAGTATSRAAGTAGTRAAGPVAARRPVTPARRPRARVVTGAPSCLGAASQPIAASSAVQLTRRGWVVLLSAATAVAAVLVWLAYLSHPSAGSTGPAAAGASAAASSRVVVQSGDTLWSIAHRVAPERDPRAVVYALQQANHLTDSTVVAGQVLRLG